jgi:hypothetical protein
MATVMYTYRKVSRRMSVGAAILATFLILIEMAVLFAKPAVSFDGSTYYVGQGIAAFAILMGGLFWAITEMFTRAGRGFWTLVARFGFSFLIGAIFGGIIGALVHFGRLVIIPASAGNALAGFLLFAYLFLFGCIVTTAAYLHGLNSTGKMKGGKLNVN